eukprot:1613195-Prymnesium_polylepis.1
MHASPICNHTEELCFKRAKQRSTRPEPTAAPHSTNEELSLCEVILLFHICAASHFCSSTWSSHARLQWSRRARSGARNSLATARSGAQRESDPQPAKTAQRARISHRRFRSASTTAAVL